MSTPSDSSPALPPVAGVLDPSLFEQPVAPIAGSLTLSALLACAPIVLLLVLLAVFRVRSHIAALPALAATAAIAAIGYGMPPLQAASAAVEGMVFGVLPIMWIVLHAVWISRLIEESGNLTVLRSAFLAISADQRLQALVIAFCFGGVIGSVSGFGAPVTIVATILIAMGFPPIRAVVLSLFADAAGAAFGSVGTPVLTLEKVTGLPAEQMGMMMSRQSAIVAFGIPFVLLLILDGRRAFRQLWPAALAMGACYAVGQLVAANLFTFRIADLAGAVFSTAGVLLLLRFWAPPEEPAQRVAPASASAPAAGDPVDAPLTRASVLRALSPYLILTGVLAVVSFVGPMARLGELLTTEFAWPALNVTTSDGTVPAIATFSVDWLTTTGSLLLITGVLSAVSLGVSWRGALRSYLGSLLQIRYAAATVILVLGLAYVLNFSGQAATIGFALAQAGPVFVLLAAPLGWVGTAASGSATSANSLFAGVQTTAAQHLGESPYLLASANSVGAEVGKVVSPQNLAMASAAVKTPGQEGVALRATIGWSLAGLAVLSLLVWLQSTPVLGWMVVQ